MKLLTLLLTFLFGLSGQPDFVLAGTVSAPNGKNEDSSRMPAPSQAQNNSTYGAASQGSSSQYLGAAMNGAMGTYFAGSCGWKTPVPCVLSGISFAQAAATLRSAKQSKNIQNQVGNGLPEDYEVDIANGDENVNKNELPAGYKDAFESLTKKGYTVKKNGIVIGPNGKKYSPSDFSSDSSMANAGFSESDISGMKNSIAAAKDYAEKELKEGANDPSVVAMGVDGGGGGYRGMASEGSEGFDADQYLKGLKNPFGMNAQEKAKLLAGKTLTVGNEQIGVKVDDLFMMLHRRYQSKRTGEEFIEAPKDQKLGAPSKPGP